MFSRRLAIAAVLLAVFGAACAGRGNTSVAAGASSATHSAAPVVTTTTTAITTTTLPPTTKAPATIAPAKVTPAMTTSAAPAPASIEVDYQPTKATRPPRRSRVPTAPTESLGDGSALFSGLPAGTYAVTITIRSEAVPESGGTAIDGALQILNGNSVHVEAGDHGLITCTDDGCVGGQ